jgi:hypothetical protein
LGLVSGNYCERTESHYGPPIAASTPPDLGIDLPSLSLVVTAYNEQVRLPILLEELASRADAANPDPPILMPAYSETDRIEQALRETFLVDLPCAFEIGVDDDATDETTDLLCDGDWPDNVCAASRA